MIDDKENIQVFTSKESKPMDYLDIIRHELFRQNVHDDFTVYTCKIDGVPGLYTEKFAALHKNPSKTNKQLRLLLAEFVIA